MKKSYTATELTACCSCLLKEIYYRKDQWQGTELSYLEGVGQTRHQENGNRVKQSKALKHNQSKIYNYLSFERIILEMLIWACRLETQVLSHKSSLRLSSCFKKILCFKTFVQFAVLIGKVLLMSEMKWEKSSCLIIPGVVTIWVQCRTIARPVGAETILGLADVKCSTQATLGGTRKYRSWSS